MTRLLVYRLLKVARLPTRDKQLVKATITELKYDSVKSKLRKIFSDNSEVPTSKFNGIHIKTEPVYHTQSYPEDDTFDQTNYENEDPEFQHEYLYKNDNTQQNEHHILYAPNNKHPVRTKGNQSYQQPFQCGNYQQPNYYQQNYQQQNYQQPNYQLLQSLTTNSNWRNP